MFYNRLYQLTKNEKYRMEDSSPTYADGILGTPFHIKSPFHLFIPYEQKPGDEYFMVCDHFSSYKCTKAAAIF